MSDERECNLTRHVDAGGTILKQLSEDCIQHECNASNDVFCAVFMRNETGNSAVIVDHDITRDGVTKDTRC